MLIMFYYNTNEVYLSSLIPCSHRTLISALVSIVLVLFHVHSVGQLLTRSHILSLSQEVDIMTSTADIAINATIPSTLNTRHSDVRDMSS